MHRLLLALFFGLLVGTASARPEHQVPFQLALSDSLPSQENTRVVAALLTVALGPFGVHRMYLGTEVQVPVMYTLSLGGGMGILPLVDLLCILFTKDYERYLNHPGFFMWVPAE